MEKHSDALSERIRVLENLVKFLQQSCSKIESAKRNQESTMETEQLRKSLEKRLEDLERREKEFDEFEEVKKRKLESEEEELRLKRQKFRDDVKMKNEALDEHLVSVTEHVERLVLAKSEIEGIRRRESKKMKEIEFQELKLRTARELLAERERKVDMIIGTLDDRICAVEKREKEFDLFLEGKMREMVLKDENLRLKWEEFVEQVKLADEKFRGQEKLNNGIMERLEVAENKLERTRAKIDERLEEIEFGENAAWKSVAASVKEAHLIRESMEKALEEFEKMKGEFNLFQEEKMRELASQEKLLDVMSKELAKDAKLRNEELIEREELAHRLLKRLELARDNVEDLKRVVDERFKEIGLEETRIMKMKEIESQELKLRTAQESLAETERKVDMIIGMLDDRICTVEKREKEFDLFTEGKTREMALKEEQLRLKWEEFVEQVKLADEKFRELEKLKNGFMERLELAEEKLEAMRAKMNERLEEIEFREKVAWESVAVSVKEADFIRESMEKQLEEFEKMKGEFNLYQEEKMRELASQEKLLDVMSKDLAKDAEFRNEELIEREELAHQLLKRLELAQDNVEGLRRVVDERFKEIVLEEIRINSISDWVEGKMDEVDSKAKELEEKEERIKIKEDNVIFEKNELQGKKKELDLKEKNLWAWERVLEVKQKEVDLANQLNEQRLEKLDMREKNLNSVREFTRSCFKEHLAIKGQLRIKKDLVEKSARDLQLKEESLQHELRELEFREKQMRDHLEELELQQRWSDVLNAHVKIEPDESVDLKFTVRMDGKTLQKFLNDSEKDLESMGDEIFKVLHLSSDPAKLVLDAMVGFYPPHLREEDEEFNVRRTCISLLEQLIKMPQKLKPCVRQEAIKLATAWKSKMRATAENPNSLEVLGFLLLLAAYNLASCFDKDEISSFLKMVAQQRVTPELYHALGFAESTTGVSCSDCNALVNHRK